MARRQSTSGTRARRNRRIDVPSHECAGFLAAGSESASVSAAGPPAGTGLPQSNKSLEETIEAARGRLSHAQSILGCLHVALLSAEQNERNEPGCADVAAIALRLVREGVHRLDSIYIRPLVEALKRTAAASARAKHVAQRR